MFASTAPAAERAIINFDSDWRFFKSDPGTAAAAPDYDDKSWNLVSAPHTYNDIDTFDHWSVPGHRGEQGQWGGRTWYRKTFTIPESYRGRKVYVEFQGVRQVADVYLNGRLLGTGKTGFTPFGFDLTDGLHFGASNVIAILCDNRFMKDPMDVGNLAEISKKVNAEIPDEVEGIRADQIPWNNPHWHPAHGGIYRDVFLHVTDPLHITLPLYSFLQTEGPYLYATDISNASARVTAEVPVQNGRATDQTVEVRADIVDVSGRSVLTLAETRTIRAGSVAKFVLGGVVNSPQLWEPDYPYLYQVRISLRVNGATVDTNDIPFGIRTVRWTTDAGVFVNGHHVKLHGWGQKPTNEWPGLGAAQPEWMHFYTLQLMKQAGGNWVRWGHSAAAGPLIDAGDRLGIMAEQPGVDGESDTVKAAWKLRVIAWRDMVIYFRNHPSIVIWEGGNQKVSLPHVRELRGIVDTYDPHGGRAYAHRRADQVDAKYMQVGIGTEGGREIAQLPVVEGEYDREESPRRVWDKYSPPNFGYPEAANLDENAFDLTSEEYAVNEVGQYMKKVGASYHSGGANWIFSDTTSGGRVRVEVARASGEVDGVRLPKEAYYVCAAMFRPDPQVHIIGHWTYPSGTKKTVFVASNGDAVELFVNGHSVGKGAVSDQYLFTFKDVAWEAGEIRALATRGGRPWASEAKHTVGPPAALKLTVITAPGGLRADGSDVALFDAEVVDAKGDRCPTFQDRVDFDCEGPAVWRGGYNSGKINSINNKYLDLECGINRVSVRAGFSAGDITVSVHKAGLKPASVTVRSVPAEISDGLSPLLPDLPSVALPRVRPQFAVAGEPSAPRQAPIAPPSGQPGRFIKAFSYSGPTTIAHVEVDAENGKNVYVDRDLVFADLPVQLKGADWAQAGNADALYSAVDFMELAVTAGATVFVAHDDHLAPPAWLTQRFTSADIKLAINGHPMTVYRHRASEDESLTLGSNSDDTGARGANMYVVFVKAAAAPGDPK